MTLEEKYPNVYRALEVWSKEHKEELKRKLDEGALSDFEYLVIFNKFCLNSRAEVEDWLNEEKKEVGFNKNHPELKEGEMFYSNDDDISFGHCQYKSKRKGKISYDDDGRNLTKDCSKLFPTFISVKEFEWDKTHSWYS